MKTLADKSYQEKKNKTGIDSHSPTNKREMQFNQKEIALSFLNVFCRKALSGSLSPSAAFYLMPKLSGATTVKVICYRQSHCIFQGTPKLWSMSSQTAP